MGAVRDRLAELDVQLPNPWTLPPGIEAAFDMIVVSRGQAFVAGHGPVDGAQILMRGVVGEDLTVEDGYASARLTGLSILATLERELGTLDRVVRWLRAVVYVNAPPGLVGPEVTIVANGFSDLVRQVWGDAGRHARVSPGVLATPFNTPTIVEAVVEVE